MQILLAEHRGFCYGVQRAIDLAMACVPGAERSPATVHTLGPLIHNPQMVERLAQQGLRVADNIQDIPGGTVIIRSHGAGPQIYRAAEQQQLTLVDATCPHVKKAQQAAAQLAQAAYSVVVVGEQRHPEVQSICEWAGASVQVIETAAAARELPAIERLGIVAQTTLAADLYQDIVAVLKTKCADCREVRTICTATELRQQAAVSLAGQVDAMIVVGGKNSANTARLAQLCAGKTKAVYAVETAADLICSRFFGVNTVGITAGASTPEWLIEEVYKKMQEFDQLLNQDSAQGCRTLEEGSIIGGKVVGIRKTEVFVDIGYKAEGVIPLNELAYPLPETAAAAVSEGDTIQALVLSVSTSDGNVLLSKLRADKLLAWERLEAALAQQSPVDVTIVEVVKGGLSVAIGGVRGFIPASQADVKYVEDLSTLAGQTVSVLPIEVDSGKHRAVFSRKSVLLAERERQAAAALGRLAAGQIVTGTVTRLTDFGVFVDVGGIEGLVHISDLAWHRVKTPQEIVSVGDSVEVVVLKVDASSKRIALSLKQVQRDPWFDAVEGLTVGMNLGGKVTKISRFGAFVEIKPGVEGLVHISELSDQRVGKVEDVVAPAQTVTVKIIGMDKDNKKLSLSLAQAQAELDQAEYQGYLGGEEGLGTTIGDKLGHLFNRN